MLWGCVAGSGTGNIIKVEGKMDFISCQTILPNNVRELARKLKLRRGWIFQQDNDREHCANSTKKYFMKQRFRDLEWPAQFLQLYIT